MRTNLTWLAIMIACGLAVINGIAVAQTPTQDSCALSVAACELQVQAKALRLAEAEKEIASLRAQLNDVGGKLAAERNNSAAIKESLTTETAKSAEKDKTISGQRETIAKVTAERDNLRVTSDKLALKISRANRRWTCRILHAGCIGER